MPIKDCHDQRTVLLLQERNTHSSHENFVTLIEVEVRAGEKRVTSAFSGQSNDSMMEDIEREAPARVFVEVRGEEVVSPPSAVVP